jgi:hypothetical protein
MSIEHLRSSCREFVQFGVTTEISWRQRRIEPEGTQVEQVHAPEFERTVDRALGEGRSVVGFCEANDIFKTFGWTEVLVVNKFDHGCRVDEISRPFGDEMFDSGLGWLGIRNVEHHLMIFMNPRAFGD